MTTILSNSEENNMSKSQELVGIETIEVEEIIQDSSNTVKAKEVLNALIDRVITLDEDQWRDLFSCYGTDKTIGSVQSRNVYKVITIDLITKLAESHNLQFAKDGNKIYIYNKQFWIELEESIIKYFLGTIANKLGIPTWLASDSSFIDVLYTQLLSSSFFEKMEQKNQVALNMLNGTLKITAKDIELADFNSKDFLTHQLNFQYDKNEQNKIWLDFLNDILPDKDTQKTLQQSLGYLFTKDLKLEKAIFLYGTGSNGKSVIFEVLNGILSSEMITNYTLESLTDSKGYHRSCLQNKLINYGTDISMKSMEHGIFKQLVSGEPIEVRQIYQEPFIMKNYAKLIFNLNRIDDADTESTIGFFRRMIFIPFEVTIKPEFQDKNLHKKILENKAGILNWILEGTQEVTKNKEIFISKECHNFLERFRKESNPIIRFVEEVSLFKSSNELISFQSLYEQFCSFLKQQGEKLLTQRYFNSEMKKLEYKSIRKATGNHWYASYNKASKD